MSGPWQRAANLLDPRQMQVVGQQQRQLGAQVVVLLLQVHDGRRRSAAAHALRLLEQRRQLGHRQLLLGRLHEQLAFLPVDHHSRHGIGCRRVSRPSQRPSLTHSHTHEPRPLGVNATEKVVSPRRCCSEANNHASS